MFRRGQAIFRRGLVTPQNGEFMTQVQAFLETRDYLRIFRETEQRGLTLSLRQADLHPAFVFKTSLGRIYTLQDAKSVLNLMAFLHKQECSSLWYIECLLNLATWRDALEDMPGFVYWSLDKSEGCLPLRGWLAQELNLRDDELLAIIATS